MINCSNNLDESLENRDGWNNVRIRVNGDSITMWLNGKKVSNCNDDTFSKGKIGIQVHGGNKVKGMEIVIKSMEIRALGGN